MSAVDHLFIPRHELDELAKHLHAVPSLAIDLQITTTRQDRIGVSEGGKARRDREQPLPYREHGSDAFELLHSTLAAWVRHVCEERGLTFMPTGYTHRHGEFIGPLRSHERRVPPGYNANTPAALSRWLIAHIVSLAMTEGCEEAPDEIAYAIKCARRTIDRAPEKVKYVDPSRVAEAERDAREALLSASGIEALAREIGAPYEKLTARRVYTLSKAGKIAKRAFDTGEDVFRCGDVFDAHLAYPTRRRKVSI